MNKQKVGATKVISLNSTNDNMNRYKNMKSKENTFRGNDGGN